MTPASDLSRSDLNDSSDPPILRLARLAPLAADARQWALANEDQIMRVAARNVRAHAAARRAFSLLKKVPLTGLEGPVGNGGAQDQPASSTPMNVEPAVHAPATGPNGAAPNASPTASPPAPAAPMSDAGWSPLDAQPLVTSESLADPFEDVSAVTRVELEGPVGSTNVGGYLLTLNRYNLGTQISVSGPTTGLYEVGELRPKERRQLGDRSNRPIPVVVERLDALTFAVEVHRQMPAGLRMLSPNPS